MVEAQYQEVFKYTWTQTGGGYLNVANNILPTSCTVTDPKGERSTTADMAIDLSKAEKIYCLCDTATTSLTNASTFDFKLIGSPDGTIFSDEYLGLSTAQVKSTKEDIVVQSGPWFVKPRLDVNVANVAGVESVYLYIFVNKR